VRPPPLKCSGTRGFKKHSKRQKSDSDAIIICCSDKSAGFVLSGAVAARLRSTVYEFASHMSVTVAPIGDGTQLGIAQIRICAFGKSTLPK